MKFISFCPCVWDSLKLIHNIFHIDLVPGMLILHYGLAHEYGQCLRIHTSILILLTNCLDMLDLLHNIYNN